MVYLHYKNTFSLTLQLDNSLFLVLCQHLYVKINAASCTLGGKNSKFKFQSTILYIIQHFFTIIPFSLFLLFLLLNWFLCILFFFFSIFSNLYILFISILQQNSSTTHHVGKWNSSYLHKGMKMIMNWFFGCALSLFFFPFTSDL